MIASPETEENKVSRIKAEIDKELLKREYTLKGATGETTFHFLKIPALRGDEILDEIREQFGGGLNLQNPGASGLSAFFTILTSLPRKFVKKLQDDMFQYVEIQNPLTSRVPLKGNEETAFNAIEAEPVSVKHILMRSLAVNFFASLAEIQGTISWLMSLNSNQQ